MAGSGFKGVGGNRHCEHTQQHASVLNACQRRCLTNSPSEGQSDKWLENKILRAYASIDAKTKMVNRRA